jgi:hypothetical protein
LGDKFNDIEEKYDLSEVTPEGFGKEGEDVDSIESDDEDDTVEDNNVEEDF